MTTKKISIKEIEQIIKDNVGDVRSIWKQAGTNSWLVFLNDSSHMETAMQQLQNCGFNVKITQEVIERNQRVGNIYAEFDHVRYTTYARQIKNYGGGN